MSTKLLQKIEKDISLKEYGYKSADDFLVDAIRRRMLELKRLDFLASVGEAKKAMKKSRVSERDILDDFEKFYHRAK